MKIKQLKASSGKPQWWIARDGLEDYGPYDSEQLARSMLETFESFNKIFLTNGACGNEKTSKD